MTLTPNRPQARASEIIIQEFVLKEFGHFLVVSDDKSFVNVLRRTLGSELGLPSTCLTIIPSEEQILKTVKEMSVKKKTLVLFIQTLYDHKRLDDLIRQMMGRFRNLRTIIVTTQAEAQHLALLREQGLAENWVVKPVIMAQLVAKTASVIRPHGQADKLVQAAEEYLEQGSFRNVLTICRKLFEMNPESAVGHMLMGDAYKGLDQAEDMVQAYEHASYLDETFLEPIKRLVDYFRDQGDQERVLQYLERLDALSPLNMERKVEIARMHMALGRTDEAREYFDSVMKGASRSAMTQVVNTATAIGDIYAQRGDPEAEAYYRKAIEVQGGTPDKSHLHVFNRLGILLRKNGKWKEALAEYRKALAVDPQCDGLLYNMALAHQEGEEYPQALDCARKALALNPDLAAADAAVACNLGVIFLRARQAAEGRAFLEQALRINPDHEPAKGLLAVLDRKARGG